MSKKVIKKSLAVADPDCLQEGYVEMRFNFEDDEARSSVKSYMKVGEYIGALEDIYRIVRSRIKHGDTSKLSKDDLDMLEEIRALASIYLD